MRPEPAEIILDKEIGSIVEILRAVPVVPVPAGFDQRLRDALANEAAPKETGSALPPVVPRGWRDRRRMRLAMSLAACLAVGILSLSMYNEGMWKLPFTPAGETAPFTEEPASEESDRSLEAEPADGAADLAEGEGTGQILATESKDAPTDSGGTTEPEPATEEGFAGIQAMPAPTEPAPDRISRHGGQFADFLQEVALYSSLAEEYLAGQAYTLLAYEWDSTAGVHRFTLSLAPPEGVESAPSTLVLVGSKGEIDEERQPDDLEPPVGSD